MTTTGVTGAKFVMSALAAVAVLTAGGCGTQRAGDAGDMYRSAYPTPTGISRPSAPADFRCPGESVSPDPTPTAPSSGPAVPPTDHYAENHGFQDPFPLHGQSRCDGIAVVARVQKALEPLRERGDFTPEHARDVLTGLGYAPGAVEAHQSGPTGVGFLIYADDSPLVCVEGTMNSATTEADAFGGYPDHSACDRPSGGH
ncbi:hypothetical protein [Streptomyces sp. NPDC096323]|uniref:hypothetical protein n=1 Tax=Streptomyces sp. NPDC096323 TaxID=3155822 RepID=UPI00332D0BC8